METTSAMRVKRLLFFFALFCGFLLAGLSVGRHFESWGAKNHLLLPARSNRLEKQNLPQVHSLGSNVQPDHQAAQSPPLPTLPPQQAPSNTIINEDEPVIRQNNILVIGVDDLKGAFPRLESAWLVLYLTQSPHLTLMPIYPEKPSLDATTVPPGTDLAELFQSDPQGLPGPDFFSALKTRGLWWSGYIIVDRRALAEFIDLVGGLAEQGGEGTISPGSRLVDSVPFAWMDPQGAYDGQAQIAQHLCNAATHITVNHIDEIGDIFLSFFGQILSDINREGAAAELVGMIVQGSGITCEFPSQSSENQP